MDSEVKAAAKKAKRDLDIIKVLRRVADYPDTLKRKKSSPVVISKKGDLK